MQPIVLFDIDYTLLDTDKLRVLVTHGLRTALGMSKERFIEIEGEYVLTLSHRHDFDPLQFLKHLKKSFLQNDLSDKARNLKSLFFNPGNYRQSLYPEVSTTLKRLRKKYTLGVFSEGLNHFQMAKLALSGIYEHFDPGEIFIFRRKLLLECLEILPRDSWIVDNDISVVAEVYKYGMLKPIWINRKKQKNEIPVPIIYQLDELVGLLTSDHAPVYGSKHS